MNRLVSPGIFTLALTLLAGIWITVSPFALNSQPAGVWSPVAVNNVVCGAILIGGSILGIGVHLAMALHAALGMADEQAADVAGA